MELVPAIAAARDEAKITRIPRIPFKHITLMGHSFGGLLVRTAYLIAARQYEDKLQQESPWWRLVDRIVLFAAPNRGIERRRFAGRDRLATRRWFGRAGRLTRDQLVGSEAITNLRIRWIRFLATLQAEPIVVQFLGKGDQWVDREDSFDIEQFPNAWQSDVPVASHTDLHHVAEGDVARYAILRQGILEAKPANQRDGTSRRRNPFVIVLHGIPREQRDLGRTGADLDCAKSTERVGRGADLRILSHASTSLSRGASEEGASATGPITVNCSSSTRVRASVSSDIAMAPICWGSPSTVRSGMQFDPGDARCQCLAP